MILLLSQSLTWQGLIKNHAAWDTLIWLGGLITIIGALKEKGLIDYYISHIDISYLSSMPTIFSLLVLLLIYLYSMYVCSMLTAHIAAFLGAFFVLCVSLKTPALLTIALFAYFSNLCGCLTHYSTGPVVIYFAYHYVSLPRWFYYGFLISLYHLAIWLGVGLPWWRYLGWW